MLNPEQVLSIYEEMYSISLEMLAAASLNDWDLLSNLQTQTAEQVAILQDQAPALSATDANREQLTKLIEQILDNDAAIRNIAEPWLKELSKQLHSADNEVKLARSYQSMNSL